jgi:hypothetical protein
MRAFASEHSKQRSKTNAKYSFQRRGAKKKSLEAKNQFFRIAGKTGNLHGLSRPISSADKAAL